MWPDNSPEETPNLLDLPAQSGSSYPDPLNQLEDDFPWGKMRRLPKKD